MGLFWNRQPKADPRVAELETELGELRKQFRALQQEMADVSERCYRNLKKAEARARRDMEQDGAAPTKGPGAQGRAPAAPAPPASIPWGARGRRTLRSLRSDPVLELNGHAHDEGDGDGLPT